jgi:hypothetical protein
MKGRYCRMNSGSTISLRINIQPGGAYELPEIMCPFLPGSVCVVVLTKDAATKAFRDCKYLEIKFSRYVYLTKY